MGVGMCVYGGEGGCRGMGMVVVAVADPVLSGDRHLRGRAGPPHHHLRHRLLRHQHRGEHTHFLFFLNSGEPLRGGGGVD